MKKSNLITKTLILLVAIVICSFTVKKENLTFKNNQVISQHTLESSSSLANDELLLVYSNGTAEFQKQQTRMCISNNLNIFISQVTPCSTNSNAEVIKFINVNFEKGSTNGITIKSDDTDVKNGSIRYITLSQLATAMFNCKGNYLDLYSTTDTCSNAPIFNTGNGSQNGQ
ncbi:hypothetical protein [Tenacibaculum ovolyticum]|uniref:hypothetical protein n=1 Tax=Tenacibaculum ovolyticum TaxID=104270 RepID=UPI0007ED25F8|nr:hypothetical protein [Tenacibaculum ovolyticum]